MPHGSQQSDVCEQPFVPSGIQFGRTHTPVMSGRFSWQTSPGAHTGAGANTLPPQGPPSPETQPHAPDADGKVVQLAPDGHAPPHVPAAVVPHGRTHEAAGPAQQLWAPFALRHTHACSHVPFTQRSAVHGLPSLQSASVPHPGVGVANGLGAHAHTPDGSARHSPAIT